MDGRTAITRYETGGFQVLQVGVGDALPGGSRHRQLTGDQVLIELGSTGDQLQSGLVRRGKRLADRCRTEGCLDRFQRGQHPPGTGIAYVRGLPQLLNDPVEAFEERAVHRMLATGQAVKHDAIEGHAGRGVDELAVDVDQPGVWLVERATVSAGPEGVDVRTGGSLDPTVQGRQRRKVGRDGRSSK